MNFNLKLVGGLIVALGATCSLTGCSDILAGGLEITHAVSYPMRSPEFVKRKLDDDRYLLAQWRVEVNTNPKLMMRYYDRRTGTLAQLPWSVSIGYSLNGQEYGSTRYESGSPLQMVFFEDRQTGYFGCEDPGIAEPACGYMDIVLSLDGGHSFAARRIKVPSDVGRAHVSPADYWFALVRNNTLFIGLKAAAVWARDNTTRRYKSYAGGVASYVDVVVLALPLPSIDGKPLAEKDIPRVLTARMLTGDALWALDIGEAIAPKNLQVLSPPAPPRAQYTREQRTKYIESLRADYPIWAAHQTLDGAPVRQRWMNSEQIGRLRDKLWDSEDDPLEWIPFDRAVVQ